MAVPRVALIDYGLCNLGSIRRAVEMCGANPFVTADPDVISDANHIILPGVGSFRRAMFNLKSNGMDQALREQVKTGIPFLGICLGMQLLASESSEDGHTQGLDFIPGAVTLLETKDGPDRVPHIGWNNVTFVRAHDPVFASLASEVNFYFVHSYCFTPTNAVSVLGTTPYCGRFASVVKRDNVLGTQFHPEKSQRAGFQLLRNFLAS